MPYLS
jgi:Ca2+-dependent lipid-binding protein